MCLLRALPKDVGIIMRRLFAFTSSFTDKNRSAQSKISLDIIFCSFSQTGNQGKEKDARNKNAIVLQFAVCFGREYKNFMRSLLLEAYSKVCGKTKFDH